MATSRSRHHAKVPFDIHHDDLGSGEFETEQDFSMGEGDSEEEEPSHENDMEETCSESSAESDCDVDTVVQEDMDKFQQTFQGIQGRFRLIKRIGEGTFSTVYKAEDLEYYEYDNDWDIEEDQSSNWISPPLKKRRKDMSDYDSRHGHKKPKFVAIKKIYVTSSPMRIHNELDLLNDLKGCRSVCPLITAFRHTDQVVAVLPYFRHTDFREYFRNMTIPDVQIYFRSLFTALAAVHEKGILHRDIKPTNFLYEPLKKRGVLVDFGLAEREGTDNKPCLCLEHSVERRRRLQTSVAAQNGPSTGYPKNDQRQSRRANRAGTRGFRAPEVLFKCSAQTTKIDIWSAGVILLTILSRRFPFFNSADDIEAMIEIATIFGVKRMKQAAHLHGTIFETSIPTIGQAGFSLEKIILWSTCRNDGGRTADGTRERDENVMSKEEKAAIAFLERCLDLDPQRRISAEEALKHDFLAIQFPDVVKEEELDDEEDELHML